MVKAQKYLRLIKAHGFAGIVKPTLTWRPVESILQQNPGRKTSGEIAKSSGFQIFSLTLLGKDKKPS